MRDIPEKAATAALTISDEACELAIVELEPAVALADPTKKNRKKGQTLTTTAG